MLPRVAVDIGNSRTKLGWFSSLEPGSLPRPERTLALSPNWQPAELESWLAVGPKQCHWQIASVNRSGTARLLEWLQPRASGRVQVLGVADVPLAVDLAEPAKVGMDRLANALAANRLRDPARGAVVVDLGSAITVDLVSADGAFVGGAILPGIAMSAKALHQFTDLLPLEPMAELAEPPEVLGTSTTAALRSGLYWGAIGAVRELTLRLSTLAPNPHLFVTGGAGAAAAGLLADSAGQPATLVPHLTLAGVALMGSAATSP